MPKLTMPKPNVSTFYGKESTFTPELPSQVHWHLHEELRPFIFRNGGTKLYDIKDFTAKPRGVHLEIFSTTGTPFVKAGQYKYKLWLGGGVRDHQQEVYLPIGTSGHAFRTPEEAEIHATKALNWFLTRTPYDLIQSVSPLDLLFPKRASNKAQTVKQLMKHKEKM
jgi:hypothetical protein